MDIEEHIKYSQQGINLIDSDNMAARTRTYNVAQPEVYLEFTQKDLIDRLEDGYNNYLILHAYSQLVVERMIKYKQYEILADVEGYVNSAQYLASTLASAWGCSFKEIKMARVYRDGDFKIMIQL